MKLIINADDFGLTKQVNRAIVQAMQNGVVTSTTLMTNQPATEHAIKLIKEHQLDNIGLHVTLTSGRPISPIKNVADLIDENGQFLTYSELSKLSESIPPEQVYTEAMSQYRFAVSRGVNLTHIDSHHFAAFLPNLSEGFLAFANEVGLPCRRCDFFENNIAKLKVPTTDRFSARFYAERANKEGFKQTILELSEVVPNGTAEIMAHPAYEDDTLKSLSSYTSQREVELMVLTSFEIRTWLAQQGVELINFQQLQREFA
ncbi:cellobiose phosphotransferase system YdjC-like protein [Vibrio astriarenae]|nr:cellobiose phosphotransferase system YdjC-like protein [Vibrio sp. C7]